MKRSDRSPSVMQFMKLSVLLFQFQMLLFHPVLWLPKFFGFPRLLVSKVMGFPKLLWFSKGVLGLRQRAFPETFSDTIYFAFPAEIVRSCSLEESRHRSAKHWYGITLFRIFLWLLQHFSGIKPSGPTCSGKDFGGALFAPERNLQK